MLQDWTPGEYGCLSCPVHSTLWPSKRKEKSMAPRRRAANDDKPEPLPMSKNDLQESDSCPRNSLRLFSASTIRAPFKRSENAPNSVRIQSADARRDHNFLSRQSRNQTG